MSDYLVKQFTLLGMIPMQNWMLLALAIFAAGIAAGWWSNRE
jgi:hypothetical protein